MGAYQKKRLAKEPGENGRLSVLKRNRMFHEDLGTFPGWNAEFAGDAHRRDLSEHAASNVSSDERRLFLDLKIAFRVNQNGMDTLKLQPVKNLVRSYRHGDLRKLH